MHIKKLTQKDRYGNTMSYEFEVPEKGIDQTKLMEKAMELGIPPMTDMSMDMEMSMGDPMSHPGGPKGSDTVPAWLTPGEFVVNAEAMEVPGVEEQITDINNMGREIQMAKKGGYMQQGGKVAKAIGQLVAEQKQEVPFVAGPLLTDETMYAQQGMAVPTPGPWTKKPAGIDELLHEREGFVPEIYLDSLGKPTVGYGHLIEDAVWDKNDPRVGTKPYSEAQLKEMFESDRAKAQSEAVENVGRETFTNLTPEQQTALTSMAFQLGGAGQRKFKNMLNAIKEGNYDEAAKQALTGSKGGKSKWLKQTPKRAMDLAMAFSPNVAAQYKNAGGVVYASDGGWQSFLNKYVLGPKTQLPTADVDTMGGVDTPSYPWQPPTPGIPTYMTGEEGDLGTAQQGPSDAYLNEMYGDMTDFGTGEGVPQMEERQATADHGSITDDMGLVGSLVDWFGGPSGAAQVEHEERADQQAGMVAQQAQENADLATEQAVVAETQATEIDAAADAALGAGDYAEYARLRNESARAHAEAERARAEAESKTITSEEKANTATNAEGRIAERETERQIRSLDEAMQQAREAGDTAAVEALQGEKDALEAGQEAAAETDTENQQETLENIANAPAAEGETGPGADQEGETVETDVVEEAGNSASDGKKKQAESMMKSFFGDLFDGTELKRMAILYAGSRLMGYSHAGSMKWAAGQYLNRVDAKAEGIQRLTASGKYTPESIQAYRESGDISDLQAVGAPQKRTGNFKTFYKDGKSYQAEEVDINGNKVWVTADGTQINATFNDDPANVPGTKEYSSRVKDYRTVTADQLKSMRTQFDRFGEGDNIGYRTDINPHTSAGKIAEWAAKNGVDPNDLAGLVESAYHDAMNDQRQDGSRARDLVPYLNQLVIRHEVGENATAFHAKGYDPEEKGPPQYVNAEKLAGLNKSAATVLQGMGHSGRTQDLANIFYTEALTDWNQLDTETQEKYIRRAKDDESGFFVYANEMLMNWSS